MRRDYARHSWTSAVVAACLTCAACQRPIAESSFTAPDPPARIAAAANAAATNDRQAIGPMIAMLESDDAAQRIAAIQGLETMTGQKMGYFHADPPEIRAEAVDRWRRWHQEGFSDRASNRP